MCVKCVRKEDNLCTMRRGRIDITKREHVGTEKRERDKETGKAKHLGLSQLTETSDGGSDGGSSRGAEGPSTTGNDLLAGTALPDADSLALDRVLAAESAGVLGVLRDFDLLDLTTERSTVTGTVLSGDSDLDSSLRLLWLWVR